MVKRLIPFLALMFVHTAFSQTGVLPVYYCTQAGKQAQVSGIKSTNYMQGIVPSCTVTVYLTGTQTLATTTPQSPLAANTDGSIPPIRASISQSYDVVLSGGVSPNIYPSPETISGVYPSQNVVVTTNAGGSNGQVQYNNSGSLAGSAATIDSAGNFNTPASVTASTVAATTPIAIPSGGTGASTAAGALSSIGALPAAGVQVVGQGTNSTIQAAITAAGTTGSVQIPAIYAGTDSYTNPNGIQITDQRAQTAELNRLAVMMTPWLTKLGASSGGNLTTLAKCIAAGGPCVVDGIGNSILGGGQFAYQNSIWMQMINALRAQYPTVNFVANNYTLGGRLTSNALPAPGTVQDPLCPTNAPACYTIVTGTPYNTISNNPAYGYANAPSGVTNASFGHPFQGATDFPWPVSPQPNFTGWLTVAENDNPDALFLHFTMNDEGNAGYTFAANVQAIIAPFLALPKVPTIVLWTGPNGSISPSGQAYFTPASKYSNLDEFAADLRGLAKEYSYGLIDDARIFNAIRDGSDPESPLWELDTTGFNNYATNWAVQAGSAAITNGGYTASISAQGAVNLVRMQATRDSLIAGVWDTTDTHTIPKIFWRAPSSTTLGYQALLGNQGSGNWTVTVYSLHGPGYGIAQVNGSGLTNSTSFMVQASGNEYRVWVNGVLVLSPDTASCGAPAGAKCGYDYDSIGYGYSGVGTTTSTIGTSYTSSITSLTLEYGSPQPSCATPIANRQSNAPCSPGLVSDQAVYGWATDFGSNLRSLGGNQVNHPSFYGETASYGIAAVPFFDHLQSQVAWQKATADTTLAHIGASNSWTATQYLPVGSGVRNAADQSDEWHWTDSPSGTGISAGSSCSISHRNSGGGAYALAFCIAPGTGNGGVQVWISGGLHAVGSESWTQVWSSVNATNIIYRCPNSPYQVYWGSTPPSGCGTPVDTGLRAQ